MISLKTKLNQEERFWDVWFGILTYLKISKMSSGNQ